MPKDCFTKQQRQRPRAREAVQQTSQLEGPTASGALTPAPPPKADSGCSPFPLLLLKPASKSEVKRAMETALTSGRLGGGEGTQSVGLLRPQAHSREVEFTKSGFQWMPETTLKKVLRHCECSLALLCPPMARSNSWVLENGTQGGPAP